MKHRLIVLAPYCLALACLCLVAWAAWRLIWHPDIGASWSISGKVTSVTSLGPADGHLKPGDHIVSVDTIPVAQAAFFFPGKHVGETVQLVVERDAEPQTVDVTLVQASLAEVLSRLLPVFVALVFLGTGAVVQAQSPVEQPRLMFFLFCQVVGAALASGAVSAFGPAWVLGLFDFLVCWLGPLAVHFHLYFPVPATQFRLRRWVATIYVPAVVGSFIALIEDPLAARAFSPASYLIGRVWLTTNLLVVIGLLIARTLRHATYTETQRQVGVVALGGIIALVPFLALSLLPDALFRQPYLPYYITLLFLSVIPLAYGYSILRNRLTRFDRMVSRGAAYTLVLLSLSSLYLTANTALSRLPWSGPWQQSVANLLLVLLAAVVAGPLHRRLQVFVDHLLHGGWYDYRSAVQQLTRAMYGSSDRAALAQMLSQEIQSAMRLKCACLLLSDAEQNLVLCHPPNRACPGQMPGSIQLDVQSRIRQHFDRHLEPIEATRLHEITGKGHLTGAEAGLLLCPHARLWLPLPGSDHLLGLLILGAKHGGDAFDRTDLDILEVVARHAGITLQNAELIAELRARALEVEQLHQQVVRAREDERKRVARELHDQTIQALIGLNYQLAEARHHSGADGWPIRLQAEVRQIVSDVRQICTDLRPATLDTLGLVAAVRARVREVQGQAPFRIKLTVEGNEDQEVPDEVALCVYRVLHEALLNIQKHAAARQVSVTLSLTPDEVLLTVADDGHGFVLPKRLGQLTDAGHFGLVGVRERLNLVHGRLEIASIPSQGTQLVACVPLNQPVQ